MEDRLAYRKSDNKTKQFASKDCWMNERQKKAVTLNKSFSQLSNYMQSLNEDAKPSTYFNFTPISTVYLAKALKIS